MSPRRQPCSLLERSLAHASRSLDEFACAHSRNGAYNRACIEVLLQYITDNLPTNLLIDIGKTIIEHHELAQKPLLSTHIKILLRLKVRSLSLSGSVLQSEVLGHESASHLERLALSYSGCFDGASKLDAFLGTAERLSRLECIAFCTDRMMQTIATSCHNLVSLNLRSCDVTDEGVLRLCGLQCDLRKAIDLLHTGNRLVPTAKCAQTLREIRFSMTKITEAGVAIILLALTNIHILRIPDITMKMLYTFLKTIDHKGVQCRLKEFHSREVLDEEQLVVLTGLCPNLEYIQMSFTGAYNTDLARLEKLINLKQLKGAKLADINIDSLMVFLKEIGWQLEYLFLYTYHKKFLQEKLKITHTHLWNLAKCCPNLNSLTLDSYSLDEDPTMAIPFERNEFQFFKNLHTLKLKSMNLSGDDLRVFLYKCRNMTSIELILKDTSVLHDNFLNELLNKGVWNNLTKVTIMNSTITNKMMFRLVNECPNLQFLGSLYTWCVAKEQIVNFKEKIRQQNFDIEIY